MSTESNSKYKAFRNFLYNDLGITREDIKEWTKEAIQETVTKIVGQMNVAGIIRDKIGYELKYVGIRDEILRQVATEMAKELTITVQKKEPQEKDG